MRRNSLRAGAALAAALAAGCGRPSAPPAPAPDPAGGVTLAAPAPSSSVITSPLGSDASGYTNEMQAQNLRDQAAALGISRFARPSNLSSDGEDPRPTITYQEGLDRTREMAGEIEAQRHALEKDKYQTVAIPSQTPAIISGDKQGAPIDSPSTDAGTKDPDSK